MFTAISHAIQHAMTPTHLPIFVYGTLKQGQVRETCWPHPPISIVAATTSGNLYDLGPYPALQPGPHPVAGELWHMRPEHLPETLRVLDEIEGYAQSASDQYVREVVQCQLSSGSTEEAYTYLYAKPIPNAGRKLVLPNEFGRCIW